MNEQTNFQAKAYKNQEFIDPVIVERFYVVRQHVDSKRWSVGVGTDGEILVETKQFATAEEALSYALELPLLAE